MKKKQIGIIVTIAVIILAAAAFLFMNRSKDGYRSIKIYQVNGNALLDRSGIGEMDAYENLLLQNKDLLQVLKESNVRLLMDEDKFALVEQESRVSINAQGNSDDSKTNIMLEYGKVTVEIKNKLNGKSTFEVTTPNAVMAVRGTVFHVNVEEDADGNPITTLTVLEGKVATAVVAEDGTKGEEILVEKGGQALIENREDGVSMTTQQPDYHNLTEKELEFLDEVSKNGKELSISTKEILKLHEEIVQRNESLENGDSGNEEFNDLDHDGKDESDDLAGDGMLNVGHGNGPLDGQGNQNGYGNGLSNGQSSMNRPGNEHSNDQGNSNQLGNGQGSTNRPETNSPNVPSKPETNVPNVPSKPNVNQPSVPGDPGTEQPNRPNKPGTGDTPGHGESDKPGTGGTPGHGESDKPGIGDQPGQGESDKPGTGGTPGQGETDKPGTGDQPGQGESNKPGSGNTPGQGESDKPGSGGTPGPGENPELGGGSSPGQGDNSTQVPGMDKPQTTKNFTVTFRYQGQIFATVIVKSGELVQKPKLKPLVNGEWNYDFTKAIMNDIVIEFKVGLKNKR